MGGTWYENTYPGCRVDVPNHFYSYSFAQSSEWPQFFSTQPALLEYFRRCADELELRPLIRFGTEVLEARFDEPRQRWSVTTRGSRRHGDHRGLRDGRVSGRAAQPAEVPGHPRSGGLRRAVVPLGAVGSHGRPDRQAGGGDRHRRQRRPAHPPRGRGGERAARVPAHTTVAGPHPELPRRPARRSALVHDLRPGLRALGPARAVLAHARGVAPRRRRRPRVAGPAPLDEPAERDGAPAADRPPRSRVHGSRAAGQDDPDVPAARQAHRARQRQLAASAAAAARVGARRRHRGRHGRAGSAPSTASSTTST